MSIDGETVELIRETHRRVIGDPVTELASGRRYRPNGGPK